MIGTLLVVQNLVCKFPPLSPCPSAEGQVRPQSVHRAYCWKPTSTCLLTWLTCMINRRPEPLSGRPAPTPRAHGRCRLQASVHHVPSPACHTPCSQPLQLLCPWNPCTPASAG